MRLCIAMMCQNEEKFIDLHFRYMSKCTSIDGVVILDGGSTDSSIDIIKECYPNAEIYKKVFDWNFSNQANSLIDCAEGVYSENDSKPSYDIVLRLDPDELMFLEDISYVKYQFENGLASCLEFPRYNFKNSRLYTTKDYPDYQARAWLLHRGIKYSTNKMVHETLLGFSQKMDNIHIFHYESLNNDLNRRWLKHMNYSLLAQGKAPLDKVPDDFVVPDDFDSRPYELFKNDQPLNPYLVGINAPFGASN